MRVLVGLGAVAVFLFLTFQALFGSRTISWNQRLTLVVETPQGEVRGSAVTRVTKTETSGSLVLPEARGVRSYVTGEAVVVEVAPGRYLFALLSGSEDWERDAASGVYSAYQLSEVGSHGVAMARIRTQPYDIPVPLPPEAWPMLVTFDDITKPETVREVDPANLAAVFGEGVGLKAVTLEITEETVTVGRVEGVLGWLEKVGREQANLIGRPASGLVSDQPNPRIYMITPLDFSTDLFK